MRAGAKSQIKFNIPYSAVWRTIIHACTCICSDAQKCQAKYEKLAKAEKTGANVVKAEAAKKAYQSAKDEFDHQNRCHFDDLKSLVLDCFQMQLFMVSKIQSQRFH